MHIPPAPCTDNDDAWSETADRARRADVESVVLAEFKALSKRARYLTTNRSDAMDLVQETILRALDAQGRSARKMTRAWLMTTLYNLFVDTYRARQVARRLSPAVDHSLATHVTPYVALDGDGPAISWWADIDPASMERALERLPSHLAATFRLYSAGASYHDIGCAQGINTATVGTRLHRARHKLRSLLVSEYERTRGPASVEHDATSHLSR